MVKDIWAGGSVGASGDWAVSDRLNLVVKHELNELRLNAQRMKFHLVADWCNSTVTEHVPEHLNIKVGYSNASDKTTVNQSFHLSPNLVHRNFDHLMLRHSIDDNLSRSNWPVNKIEIKILNSKLLHRSSASCLYVLDLVWPNLGDDENLFSGDGFVHIDDLNESLSNQLLILVETSAVKHSIAKLCSSKLYD
jgi:hypothetical protein